MKKSILIAACAIPFVICSTALAEVYVSGNIGLAMLNDSDTDFFYSGYPVTVTFESDSGLALGLAVGYAFKNSRIEVEYAYQQNDLEEVEASIFGFSASEKIGGETNSNSFLLNGYYDFKNTSSFTPFLSGGIGLSKVEVDSGGSADDTVFAYQLGGGVAYAITDKFLIDLKYRYFATDDPELDGFEIEYSSHNFYLGGRFSF